MDYLSSGPLNLSLLRDSYQRDLLNHLDTCEGPKSIYWEKSLIAPVNLIVSHSLLKEHGVTNSFMLENSAESCPPPNCKSVIFILSSNVRLIDIVLSFLKKNENGRQKANKSYHIIAIPSFTYACKTFLTEKDTLQQIKSIYEFPLALLPIDSDVLSVEDPDCYARWNLFHKQQAVYHFVQGLMRFQSVFGLFPKIRAKGGRAKEAARMLIRMRHEADALAHSKPNTAAPAISEIDTQTEMLIILDRSVDVLTPLLNQLTYEGLIDDKWGIQHGVCRFSKDQSLTGDQFKRVHLNSGDEIFTELRDQNFACVGSILSRSSKEISALVAKTKEAKRLTELRRVVDQLPELQVTRKALETHTLIAEQLQKHVGTDDFMLGLTAQQDFIDGIETDKAHPYIEDCILRNAPLEEVLRLMCIQSFCNGGLKRRLLEYYKREILQVYGFEHIFTLENLCKLGLLYDSTAIQVTGGVGPYPVGNAVNKPNGQSDNSSFQTITAVSGMFNTSLKKHLRLLVPPSSAANPNDTEQVLGKIYSGFIPISIRLIQSMTVGWLPKTVSALGGQLTQSGVSNAKTFGANAILAGKRLLSGLRPDEFDDASRLIDSSSPSSLHTSSVGLNRRRFSTEGTNFITALTPGTDFEEKQIWDNTTSLSTLVPSANDDSSIPNKSRVIVVAFLGGVTYAELSALRTLASCIEGNLEFVVVTTGFINAHVLLQSLEQDIRAASLIPF